MYKKLLSILCLGSALITFNSIAEEVTVDMLDGEWHCDVVSYKEAKGIFDDTTFDYQDKDMSNAPEFPDVILFKKVGGNHVSVSERGKTDSEIMEFKATETNEEVIEDDSKLKSFYEYKYINHDQFELIKTLEVLYYDSDHHVKSSSYGETSTVSCLRVE